MQVIHTNRPRLEDIKLHYNIIKRTFFETKLHFPPNQLQSVTISYNIYQTLKLLVTHVVLTLVTLDQMVYKSQSSVTIFIKL